MNRGWCALLLPALLACTKAKPAEPTEEGSAAALELASAGVLVRRLRGECSTLPCVKGSCPVLCPPTNEMLRVDVVEPLRGKISVRVGDAEVVSENVPAVPTTGLTLSVGVRPLSWPATVEVHVNERSGSAEVVREKPFLTTRETAAGPLNLEQSAAPHSYE